MPKKFQLKLPENPCTRVACQTSLVPFSNSFRHYLKQIIKHVCDLRDPGTVLGLLEHSCTRALSCAFSVCATIFRNYLINFLNAIKMPTNLAEPNLLGKSIALLVMRRPGELISGEPTFKAICSRTRGGSCRLVWLQYCPNHQSLAYCALIAFSWITNLCSNKFY